MQLKSEKTPRPPPRWSYRLHQDGKYDSTGMRMVENPYAGEADSTGLDIKEWTGNYLAT